MTESNGRSTAQVHFNPKGESVLPEVPGLLNGS